jgi:hypothetical protein
LTRGSQRSEPRRWAHEHEGARAAPHHAVAGAQRQLAFEDVKDLFDLGVVLSARIEAGGDREFEHGAAFGVLAGHEEIDLRPAEGHALRLAWL